jgi:hypothetical protein
VPAAPASCPRETSIELYFIVDDLIVKSSVNNIATNKDILALLLARAPLEGRVSISVGKKYSKGRVYLVKSGFADQCPRFPPRTRGTRRHMSDLGLYAAETGPASGAFPATYRGACRTWP